MGACRHGSGNGLIGYGCGHVNYTYSKCTYKYIYIYIYTHIYILHGGIRTLNTEIAGLVVEPYRSYRPLDTDLGFLHSFY